MQNSYECVRVFERNRTNYIHKFTYINIDVMQRDAPACVSCLEAPQELDDDGLTSEG